VRRIWANNFNRRKQQQTNSFMDTKDLLGILAQLPQTDRITLARQILRIEPPKQGSQIDFPTAISIVAQLPPHYRQPMIALLSEFDKVNNGNSLNIEDAINMAHTMLVLTQNLGHLDAGTGIPASIPYDLMLEINLRQ